MTREEYAREWAPFYADVARKLLQMIEAIEQRPRPLTAEERDDLDVANATILRVLRNAIDALSPMRTVQ